jgi:hypothetical protein
VFHFALGETKGTRTVYLDLPQAKRLRLVHAQTSAVRPWRLRLSRYQPAVARLPLFQKEGDYGSPQ